MPHGRGTRRQDWIRRAIIATASIAVLVIAGSCRTDRQQGSDDTSYTALRVGVGQASTTNPAIGLRQLSQNVSVEGLGQVSEDGRVEPRLAEKWTPAGDGRSLLVTLRPGVKFHDGSPLDSKTVAAILPDGLRSLMGPLFEDIDHIKAVGDNAIEIGLRRQSTLLLESLEVPIKKPGPFVIATGAFVVAPDSTTELRANTDYYLGRPHIDEIRIVTFPAVRTAWAELLRNRIDMLYEVGPDALDSLESSTNVGIFTFTRRYQYLIVLNVQAPIFRSASVRRALNIAVDRPKLVRGALNGHGVPSSGPIWPRYWALPTGLPTFEFNPAHAADMLTAKRQGTPAHLARVRFTCLIPSDSLYERIALELKQQLQAVGVEMDVRAATQDELFEAQKTGKYEAMLIEGVSGPTLLRLFFLWHSNGAGNPGSHGNPTVDAAFDRVRLAESDAEYRQGVAGLHQAFMEDPPAIFLAWSERARAVSKRFTVPAAEPGRDILSNLRLWQPSTDSERASRN